MAKWLKLSAVNMGRVSEDISWCQRLLTRVRFPWVSSFSTTETERFAVRISASRPLLKVNEMSYTKYAACPVCKSEIIKEHYVKKIYLYRCGTCGFPNMSLMMPYYEGIKKKYKLDFIYAFLEHIDGRHGLVMPKAANGNVLSLMIPSMMGWHTTDEVRGSHLYAVINIAKDGSFYEFRGIYSNPYFAQDACDEIDYENERRGIKAKANYEQVPLNHPCGSSMFKEGK